MDKVIASNNLYKKDDILRRVEELKKEEKLWSYYKNFYWILLNYITAYRNISTGL